MSEKEIKKCYSCGVEMQFAQRIPFACILSAKVPFLQKTHTIPVLLKRRTNFFNSEEN